MRNRSSKSRNQGERKDPLAVELGRRGGLRGGLIRAKSLSPERRSQIAAHAARTRWSTRPPDPTRAGAHELSDGRRRKGAVTRLSILEAARALLSAGGPEAIRLQEVARRAGVSHSTVLHHFGSRLGLIEALADFALEGLHRDMLAAIAPRMGLPIEERVERTKAILDRTAEVYGAQGYARLIAGILLAGEQTWPHRDNLLAPVPAALHAARVERRRKEGLPLPAREDTLLGYALVGVALFGDALYGPILRRGLGLPGGPEGAEQLRHWLAQVLEAIPPFILEPGSPPPGMRPVGDAG